MRTRSREEIARMGDEIYERCIRPEVEPENIGKIIAIDVDSGNWAMADGELAAAGRLREQRADAVNVWLLRVGYQAIASLGGGAPREDSVIRGVVNTAHEAVVTLTLQGSTGRTMEIDTVVDTGCNLFLTLPPTVVTELGSAFTGVKRAVLADGSESAFDTYGVTVLWDGRTRHVTAFAVDATPLAGMALLHRYSLYAEVEEGGSVLIRAMQP